jgi:hypothetical protein
VRNEPIAKGVVESLCINGKSVKEIKFGLDGPVGDVHSGFSRRLSGHDGDYIRTSSLAKGDTVFNWRTWTGISMEELDEIEGALGCFIPQGCLLENLRIRGVPSFSKLDPTTRLVFPKYDDTQLILAVWEENGPCHVVGQRLADHYNNLELKKRFIAEAQGRRGVMGFVLSAGLVMVGDEVELFPRVY